MSEKIIVAVDGSEASAAAVDWVLERSSMVHVDVELTAVVELGWSPPGGPEVDYRTSYEQGLYLASSRFAEAAPDVPVSTVMRWGIPAEALLSASGGADLLVIGTNKTGALAGILHGTLPLRVAGRSRCVTVVVPTGWEPRGSGVVVGWEDDGTAEIAAEFAATEAERRGSTLTMFHAWRVPVAVGFELVSPADAFDDLALAHSDMLSAAAKRVREGHPGLEVVEKTASGSASVALVTAAQGSELLVVGSHGRGAIGGLILGSVSHDALMNMPAPVAVVPHPDEPITVLPEILDEDLI